MSGENRTFQVETKHKAFYTGGNIEWINDTIFCQKATCVSLLSTETGTVSSIIGHEEEGEEQDVIQTFTTDGEKTVTSHKSGLLKLWTQDGTLQKMWKYIHKGPIVKLVLNGLKLASGGADSTVRIWDLEHQACTLCLRGCQGVVNAVRFLSDGALLAAGDDGKINSYELEKGNRTEVYNSHFSKVTTIVVPVHKPQNFVSCGRDKVIVLWQVGNKTPLKVIPTMEAVEVIVAMPVKFKLPDFKSDPNNIYVASGGENSCVRVWDLVNTKEVYRQQESVVSKVEEGGLAITNLLLNEKTLAVVSAEHIIVIYALKSFVSLKQFVGFSDEILDLAFYGPEDAYLAVATNSPDIKLYDNATMNCQLLKGHTDFILALATSKSNPNLLLSSSKDNTIRLWILQDETAKCIGVGVGHTGTVNAVNFSQCSAKFAVSGGTDMCLKLWSIPADNSTGPKTNLICLSTQLAHDKDINCVVVSPDDRMIVTASQDKTAKVWSDSLTVLAVLRGHRRSVWSARFAPVDRVVATSSADCTIKLWSLDDFSCLKTITGHEASVVRFEFISNGKQIVSAGADGLLKIFSMKTSECTLTLDEHEDKIWSLAVKKDGSYIVTGGGDSTLIKWKDVTEEVMEKRRKEEAERVLEEQKLSNYLHNDELLKALVLSLKLDKPFQTLKIIQLVIQKNDESGLCDAIRELKDYQKDSLLKCAVEWNTNSKYCQPAQLVFNILLGELQSGDFKPSNFRGFLEGALPYTARHYRRLTELAKDLYFLDFTINNMRLHARESA